MPSWACGPTRGRITERMKKISYSGYRFPPEIIHQAIWLYLRFTLSLRDVEGLLAERGVPVSYETVRRWVKRKMQRFKSAGSAQKFLSTHAAVYKPSTTRSTSNAISRQPKRTARSAPRRWTRGGPQSQRPDNY